MKTSEIKRERQLWIPKKERIWVFTVMILSTLIVLWELKGFLALPLSTLHSKQFEHTLKSFGSIARVLLFFVLSYYVILRVIKLPVLKGQAKVKKWLSTLLRYTRKWHTPVAIFSISLIILHTVAAFLHGFKFDFNYVSGLIALLVLLPVPISGLFRYQRRDRKWHLWSGITFAILFLLHSFL
ncbi:hypothetical protein LCM10_12880 [Rossellomorea aquimaris]|uniref:hypothetical protein n=1 Tax=Rossellomorea aquimaris TaxID=189382 RepID=UPI001CD65BB9|nr:hypothetical protein [Rossellomorea aquimaris]MCA1055885.1 hypothetical protein [Rossellomorea aquimaris]